ncbi:hypothetical protein U9M48_019152 [Paspalum notatum var. saurae]|uniref:Uncharacterized protein n=1 Tax=Paspalum notatum var. saurae TaxID=547442 RepID=A0AAQ3TDC5_PASNO
MLIKKLLPEGNKLPATTNEAKEIVCPLGLEVQKIYACPNECILYRGDYHELESCPMCKASRYKIKRDNPGDVEGEPPRKRVPAKDIWEEQRYIGSMRGHGGFESESQWTGLIALLV